MKTIRIAIGALVVVCALGALAASASATKPAMVFGEFQASVEGKAPSLTEPGTLKLEKEAEPELTGLQLGGFKFGVVEEPENKVTHKKELVVNYEQPCEKPLGVHGQVTSPKSPTLELELRFRRCVTSATHGSGEYLATSFALDVKFNPNSTGELLEIVKPASGYVKTVQRKCVIEIPAQTVPFKMNSEKEYEEVVTYSPESETVENWEKSTKLKEFYPSGEKERISIELGEKFKGIHTYVKLGNGCFAPQGEENGKLVTEGEHKGELEFTNGYIFADIEGLEVKKGELTFVSPPA